MNKYSNANHCVCCGRVIPEGTWVCKECAENPTNIYKKPFTKSK